MSWVTAGKNLLQMLPVLVTTFMKISAYLDEPTQQTRATPTDLSVQGHSH